MPHFTAADIAEWCGAAQTPTMPLDEAVHALHALGSRSRFLKLLPFGSTVLDAGAGEGSLIILRDWPAPARPDVRMFAWAGVRGGGFGRYEASETGFWPAEPPHFGGMKFDAIFSANFIEHIDDPRRFVQWAASRLTSRGRIYLEWPRPQSVDLPTSAELSAVGVKVMTGRYDDDDTHRPYPPAVDDIRATLTACGFAVTESGIARVPYIDKQVAIHSCAASDIVALTLAYWSYTGWLQYLMAEPAELVD